ncbi:hypothetical protein SO694_000920134 [Aureococcus anophagefferens]|uniref:Protein CASP n=1 Tax=Aureococcus anophagefferens TaxID=44056 RepID=A0ABR1FS43_AURAN
MNTLNKLQGYLEEKVIAPVGLDNLATPDEPDDAARAAAARRFAKTASRTRGRAARARDADRRSADDREGLEARVRTLGARLETAEKRAAAPSAREPGGENRTALAAQILKKQALLDDALAAKRALDGRLSAARRDNDALRARLDGLRDDGMDPAGPRRLKQTLKMHRAHPASAQYKVGGFLDDVDQFMVRTLRLLNSAPVFRLVFFTYLVLHHVYMFLVICFHQRHLEQHHGDDAARPNLRGG